MPAGPLRPRPRPGLMSQHVEQRDQFLEEALGGEPDVRP